MKRRSAPIWTLWQTLALSFVAAAAAQSVDWKTHADEQQRAELIALCRKGRYLNKGEASKIELPNWRGFNTIMYTNTANTGRRYSVVLLDPDGAKAADWVGNAVLEVFHVYRHDLAVSLAKHIVAQSGFHFPVSGLVDEQKYGMYAFRDGVAVRLKRLKTEPGSFALSSDVRYDEETRKYSIFAPETDILAAGFQARPASISVEEFKELKRRGSPGVRWKPADIRATYQAAWKSDRNPLITNLLRVYKTGKFPE